MPRVYAMIADGTEEIECLGTVDVLRRAGLDVTIVSVAGKTVVGSHGISVNADTTASEVSLDGADVLFIPGGMPGAKTMGEFAPLIAAVRSMLDSGKRVAAICAAPALVLGAHGFLRGKRGVCYPGYEQYMLDCSVESAPVVTDGNITTADSAGSTMLLGLELVRLTLGEQAAEKVARAMRIR